MRSRLAVLVLAFALFAGGEIADIGDFEEKAHADSAFSFNLFFDSLAPYGSWVPVEGYGYGWYPAQVGQNWQPYMDGQWAWSNQGWTWISYEPWGWATYHYGRWVFDSYYGWTWIPGATWAPAWVSWYQAPGYVGWSPLPPDNNFFLEIGISFSNYGYGYDNGYYGGYNGGYDGGYYGHHHHQDHGHYYDNDYYAPGEHCVFVPQDQFTGNNAKLVALQGPDRLTVMRNVKNVTNIKVDNNKIYNFGPDKAVIERAERGKLTSVNLVDSDLSTLKGGKNPNRMKGNDYSVFRPNIEKKADDSPFMRSGFDNTGIKNGYTSSDSDKFGGQGLVQDRSTRTGRSNPYGNSTPDGFGVIRKDNTNSLRSNMGPDTGKRRETNGDTFTPAINNPRANENTGAADTSRQFRSYNGPSVNNQPDEPIHIKSNPAGNIRQRNNYEAPTAVERQAVIRNPYDHNAPNNRTSSQPSNQANRRAINRAPVQQRNNYNPNGYNMQRPSNNHQPAQNTERNYSNTRRSNSSNNNRNTNTRPQEFTSPPMNNTGMRNFNPGNTRSYNNNSFVQDSGRGR